MRQHDVTTVHEAARHVLSVARGALDHRGGRLEDGVGDLGDGELLVVRLLGRNDRGVRAKHKVDARVWHEIRLELSDIDIQGTVEAKGGSQRRDNLGDQTVQVRVRRALDVERPAADVIDGLVVKHDGNISVLEESVRREHAIVRLDDGGRNLRRRVDAESKLGLLAVVHRQALRKERAKAGTCATSNSVEDQESLETRALVSELTHAVEDEVDDLLADGVVTTSVVIRRVFLS